jgi:hypothetical protein
MAEKIIVPPPAVQGGWLLAGMGQKIQRITGLCGLCPMDKLIAYLERGSCTGQQHQ